jgi:putative ABC transport system permease protein
LETPKLSPLYVPLHVTELFGGELVKRDDWGWHCFARLKASVTLPQAQADLENLQRNLTDQFPDIERNITIRAESFEKRVASAYSGTAWMLQAAMGSLLIISCANISNLVLARGLHRSREFAIRAALGARRTQLIAQQLIETLVVSVLGGAFGLFVSIGFLRFFEINCPEILFHFRQPSLNGGALLFSAAAIAFAAVGCGILPALSLSKTDAGAVLNDHGGRTGSFGPRQNRFLSILVAAQVALSCVLLIGAGLLMRSLQKAVDRPLGFNPHYVLTAEIQPTSGKYQSDVRKLRSLYDLVLEKARQLPGVTDAAMNDDRPFEWTSGGLNVAFWVIGQSQPQQGKEPTLDSQNISPGYFKTLEIPLLMGRDVQESDREESAKVIVIDQALAQRFFEEKNPLGRQIHIHDSWLGDGDFTIIGVVQNTLHNRPDNAPAPFQAYFSYHQCNIYREFLILRTAGDPAALMPLIQKIVSSIDPGIPATRVETFDDFVMGRYEARVFAISLMQLVSGAALFLSGVGLYGLLAYTVSQRRRELGIRIALGAQASNIISLVTLQGMKIVCAGLILGIFSALMFAPLIADILYGVSPVDPVSIGMSVLALGLAAGVSCLMPALRAIHINPIEALRE